ncbi:hypothetical protein A1359_12015 [Methylomonas lenta]|uniref:Uncharacterized protein n=1 Tax=Methylomonas lenta TaxID=980561 RepID=A0A177N8Z4_9GAMM|nr:hypothetical protein [Methylomonas lenta]OAI13659.1 hypothetical protein A1359_12015 [Methylomonas lenta]
MNKDQKTIQPESVTHQQQSIELMQSQLILSLFPGIDLLGKGFEYVVFAAYGKLPNIFMFQRGSKTTDQLGKKLLMNYQGESKIPAVIYRDIVTTCAQCCTDPLLNRKLMLEFGGRHKQYFGEMGKEFRTWR